MRQVVDLREDTILLSKLASTILKLEKVRERVLSSATRVMYLDPICMILDPKMPPWGC